jgi:hypothetical protein
MQKVVAAFLASLLLFPAGTLAQDSKRNHGAVIAQSGAPDGPRVSLRESAIRQAELAADNQKSSAAAPPSSNRPSLGSDVGKGALWGGGIGAATGLAIGLTCDSRNYECDNVPAMYALAGAMVGAMWGSIVGLVVHAARGR